ERGCELRHAPSCTALANRVSFGPGQDRSKAKTLLQKGCDLGERNACLSLGLAIETGSLEESRAGYTPDAIRAVMLIRQSCRLGNGYACSQLAKRYIEGKGVAKNPAEGIKALTQSCEAGDMSNCFELATLHRKGGAGPKDPKKAAALYKSNC